ncbi:CD151 antigen [Eupeodes corollae]|uniref:CD151 antigen n=1 Tax=Eupeodes corollae TaxID=290404 RepID=UPI0024919FBE|nr:CD151 antigen [Eupeodes corollae]XP_055906255.1 CD151 antigen [Eupeodes corollae]XP_055906257.1 CD151 antigen [Eupeodes corollae]XP_055906258.1 CD151 antigen [Eupeodes corollae]XP_055906259.1 CD151 antigen [Eupeodes corollae]XP_055906260.1 CD151 antigen [Eupeodes corollae]
MGFGSRMDCCGQFVKYSLFIANLLIFIGGLVVFCLGIWTIVDQSFMNELLGTNIFSGAVYVLIVTSVCVCILSFVGCMGAAKEVKCLLLTYFIIVFLIFVSMLIGGILGYVFREKVSQTMRQEMRASLGQYGSRRAITQAWDETQTRLRCCGVDSWHDWNRYGQIPESCCQEIFGGQRKQCALFPMISNLYSQGCLNITTVYVRDHAALIGGSAIGVAVIMIFGLIFSCLQFNMIE